MLKTEIEYLFSSTQEGYKVDVIKSQTSNELVQDIELFDNNIY